jgi:hypothetical protein
VQSWWLYSIDYNHVENIGGVAQYFHPKAHSGTPDIGAYAYGFGNPPTTTQGRARAVVMAVAMV